ncbi:uncharacterized protein LOC119227953 [Pungitius pungitius]|uniref:uncharacterized protein LOC119227953 n=1 Tax=Pungitius pungitius TaxID=134920 RepID=UPI002E1084C4
MMMRPKDLRQGSGTKTFLDAMRGGKVHLARFILDALDGRIINSKTENSRTPLMHAVCLQDAGARAKFTRLLLEKGADVNCQDEDGRTALSHACEMGHLDAVKILVPFNADPEVFDTWGNSALMYAAFSGHNQVLEFLVRSFKRLGLRLDRTNNAGHSAVEVADFFGHNQCVQILSLACRRGAGADNPPVDPGTNGEGERRLPNRLPRQVLERFSKQLDNNGDQLPGVFQRQLKIGDGAGLWNRFRSPSQDDESKAEGGRGVLFSAKQLQNCQLGEPRAKTVNSVAEPGRRDAGSRDAGSRDAGSRERTPVSFPLCGKAKSFSLDMVSGRKQSYQGDIKLSAGKLKRASLQDERCLTDRTEARRGDAADAADDKRPAGESVASQREGAGAWAAAGRRGQQKRGSPAASGGHSKPLLARGGAQAGWGLAGLGARLRRRFTAPEFARPATDRSAGGRGRISRSETFPLSHARRRRVNSQPSIDSISGVRCEFESCSSQSPRDFEMIFK